MEDKPASEMNKQELIDALTAKGVVFDKLSTVKVLRDLLAKNPLDDVKADKPTPKFLKHKVNGRVYEATEALLNNPLLEPVDG